MKIVKKIFIVLVLVLLLLQFFRPEKNISLITPESDLVLALKPNNEIEAILKTSCYDCHSNNTVYPWYSNIAPFSFMISNHVKDGKKHLDFSKWESYSAKRKAKKMEEVAEQVQDGEMPLQSYLWIHHDAALSAAQKKQLIEWANSLRVRYELEERQQMGLLR